MRRPAEPEERDGQHRGAEDGHGQSVLRAFDAPPPDEAWEVVALRVDCREEVGQPDAGHEGEEGQGGVCEGPVTVVEEGDGEGGEREVLE